MVPAGNKTKRLLSVNHTTKTINHHQSSKNDKTIQSIDSVETHAYGMSKGLIIKKEEIECNNLIKQYKNYQLWLYYKRKHKRR